MALIDKSLSYWKLDEAFDSITHLPTTAVDQGGLNTLTNGGLMEHSGGVCSGNAAFFHPGQLSSSLSCVSSASLRNGWVEWTGWVYVPTGSVSDSPLFCKSRVFPSPLDYDLHHNADHSFSWTIRNSGDTAFITASWPAVTVGWHFFDVYDTGTEIGISVDLGAFVKTTYTGPRLLTTSDFALGKNPGVGSFHFNSGLLSQLGMWNALLTDAERSYLGGVLNSGCPPTYPFTDAPGNLTFSARIEFFANLLGNLTAIQQAEINVAKPTSVFWYHENRLYCSIAGKTHCRDMLQGEGGGWTDCGYGYVNSAKVISRFGFPHIAFLAANMEPVAYGDRPNDVKLTYLSLTAEKLNTLIVPNKRVEFRPYDASGKPKNHLKQGERFQVWGKIVRRGGPRQIGVLTVTPDNGMSSQFPIYDGLYEQGRIIDQGFGEWFQGFDLKIDAQFFDNVIDFEIDTNTLEYIVLT